MRTSAKQAKATARRRRPQAKATTTVSKVSPEHAKSFFGGAFPRVKGSRFRYPAPDDNEGWCRLITRALRYRARVRECVKKGLEKPNPREKSKFEYVLYHARPEQKQRRATRNRHRYHALKNGTLRKDQELHHLDAANLKRPVPVSACQHNRMHGERCVKTLPANNSKSATTTTKSKSSRKRKAKLP